MRVTPAYLTAVATFYDMFELEPIGHHSVYVCTNISCSLRGADELYEELEDAAGERRGDQPAPLRVPRRLRHRADGLGRQRATTARSASGDAQRLVEDLRAGREPLPELRLALRRTAASELPAEHNAVSAGAALQGHRRAEPAHARGLRAPRRLPGAAQGAGDGARTRCRRARRLRPARPRRRRLPRRAQGVVPARRATWTSTSSATPTSPSPARSRTAS